MVRQRRREFKALGKRTTPDRGCLVTLCTASSWQHPPPHPSLPPLQFLTPPPRFSFVAFFSLPPARTYCPRITRTDRHHGESVEGRPAAGGCLATSLCARHPLRPLPSLPSLLRRAFIPPSSPRTRKKMWKRLRVSVRRLHAERVFSLEQAEAMRRRQRQRRRPLQRERKRRKKMNDALREKKKLW